MNDSAVITIHRIVKLHCHIYSTKNTPVSKSMYLCSNKMRSYMNHVTVYISSLYFINNVSLMTVSLASSLVVDIYNYSLL